MANKNLTNRILNQLKQKPRARGNTGPFVLPNHSGDHSAGIVRDAPTAGEDIVNKTYADTKAAASHTHAITDITSTTSAQLATLISDETGSGSLVFSSSPTISSAQLQTPILGTPQSGDLSNCTGTAAGLTAGNVTTNANLFGHVTSVGNSASLGSFSSSQLKTALTDETGSGSAVFATSPTLVTPLLGTPTSGTLTNCTGLPITGITSTTSAQLATLISDETGSGALVFANSPALTTPTLGTPASGTLTNCTGLPITGITSTTSAQLATLISDETGSGALVFANTPTLVTPVLGVATATSISFGNEALSNYDEGTFTPTVTLVGGAGNTVPQYTENTGRYVRIGRTVFVDIYLDGDGGADGAGTGQLTIALPYASAASHPIGNFNAGSLINGGDEQIIWGTIAATTSVINLLYWATTIDLFGVPGTMQAGTTRTVRLKFFYEV